jgi:hypothetical protein
MKRTSLKIIYLLVTVILLSSCSPLKVSFSSNETHKIDNIALVSTYLSIQLPVIPLLDAAVMNEKTNTISEEINNVFRENINTIRDTVAILLKNQLKCNVLYGKNLHETPGFVQLKEKLNFESTLATGKEHFPVIFSAEGDLNPFEFKNAKPEKYFQDQNNYSKTISQLCEGLNVDYIAVSQVIILPTPGSLFKPASLYMYTYLYLFDRRGTRIAFGTNIHTPIITYKPTEVEGFERVLDTHAATIKPIIEKITVKYGN